MNDVTIGGVSPKDLQQAVLMVFVSFSIMLGSLGMVYYGPIGFGPWMALLLYLSLFFYERKKRLLAPISIIMIIANTTLGLAFLVISDISYLMLSAPIIYFVLGTVTLTYQICGVPFTSIYPHGEGYSPLYRLNSRIWVCLFFISSFASYMLLPSLWAIFLPFGLMVLGSCTTIFMHFAWMGNRHERKKSFEFQGFLFEEVETEEQLVAFNHVVATVFCTEFKKTYGNQKPVRPDSVAAIQSEADKAYEGHVVRFLATQKGKPVGTIALFLDHPTLGLPFEDTHKDIDLSTYRTRGPVAEVCRFSIMSSHRLNSSLFKGLIRCMIDYSSDIQISYLFNDAFSFRVSTYKKIGFEAIGEPRDTPVDSIDFGANVQPMVINYEKTILLETITSTTQEMFKIINRYVSERYFNRLVVRKTLSNVGRYLKNLEVRGKSRET